MFRFTVKCCQNGTSAGWIRAARVKAWRDREYHGEHEVLHGCASSYSLNTTTYAAVWWNTPRCPSSPPPPLPTGARHRHPLVFNSAQHITRPSRQIQQSSFITNLKWATSSWFADVIASVTQHHQRELIRIAAAHRREFWWFQTWACRIQTCLS